MSRWIILPETLYCLAILGLLRFQSADLGGEIVVINRFALSAVSELNQKDVSRLKSYSKLQVPIITIVYGSKLEKIKMLELSVQLNGEPIWSYTYPYDLTFEQGPVFSVPLESLHERLEKS